MVIKQRRLKKKFKIRYQRKRMKIKSLTSRDIVETAWYDEETIKEEEALQDEEKKIISRIVISIQIHTSTIFKVLILNEQFLKAESKTN